MEVIIKEAGNRLDKSLADLTELSLSLIHILRTFSNTLVVKKISIA